jgi:RNA polymerase sigma-70 factor (ECF subfamily)
MPAEPTFHTTVLHRYLDGIRAGDREASEALALAVIGRMERLARCMLRDFPTVRRWADTGDVLQGALVRLLRALHTLRPATTRDFANLMATHIRRELLDLARRLRRRPDACSRGRTEEKGKRLEEVPSPEVDREDELELWSAFHERVEQLPVEEREVMGLIFYHGWTKAQIAELLGMDERTIRRRWRSACRRLTEALGGQLPEV